LSDTKKENDGCENLSKKVERFFVRKETIKNQSVTMPRKTQIWHLTTKLEAFHPENNC